MNKLIILSLIFTAACGPIASPDVVSQQAGDNGDKVILSTKDEVLKSQMNRVRGSEVISQADIRTKTKELKKAYLPDGHFEAPTAETTESAANIINHSEYKKSCGTSSDANTTLGARIDDCKKIYFTSLDIKTTWSSQKDGVSGEGNWSLVSVYASGDFKLMVWYDFSTKLIWSDYLGEANFEEAAMNLGKVCEKFEAENEFSLDSNFVTWRLPTRSDFLQADINGARYVLNNTNKDYWTSTKNTPLTAWSINQSTANSTSTKLDASKSIRCVGIPLQ